MDNERPRYIEESNHQVDRFGISAGRVLINGEKFPYSFLHINPGVCVLPVIGVEAVDSRLEQTILIRQYRFSVQSWQVELPAGAIDPGEASATAAARELTEETGYVAHELVNLGPFYPSPGSTDEIIHLYLARCDKHGGAQHLDPSEDIQRRRVPLTELERLIANGEFSHGAGLAAWARATTRGLVG